MTEDEETAWAWHIRSLDYLKCATDLWERKSTLRLHSHDPVRFLLAHSLELTLKSNLVAARVCVPSKAEDFGHDLGRAYDKLKPTTLPTIVRKKWILALRIERDRRQKELPDVLLSPKWQDHTTRIWTNDEIGKFAPEPIAYLRWLADLHQHRGSVFRYPVSRLEQSEEISIDGKMVDTKFCSLVWIAEELQNRFETASQREWD